MEIINKNLIMTSNQKGGSIIRISLPKKWVAEMGFEKEDKSAKLTFDGQKIVIEKLEKL